jgi:SAM-dependent methyltransferase
MCIWQYQGTVHIVKMISMSKRTLLHGIFLSLPDVFLNSHVAVTLAFLGNRFSFISFCGTDFSTMHLRMSKKRVRGLANVGVRRMDFHAFEGIECDSIDVCYVVEALCHSTDKEKVLRNVFRSLKPGGIFLIIDGYIDDCSDNPILQTAKMIIEKGMAVEHFEPYHRVIDAAKNVGFDCERDENLIGYILPKMREIEQLAERYFSRPRVAGLIARVFSPLFVNNAATGMVFPDFVGTNRAHYYVTVLRKPLGVKDE